MGFPVAIQTRFGTLSAALRTNYTARSKRDRVETGRNMPGTSGKCPSTFNYATACRTPVSVITVLDRGPVVEIDFDPLIAVIYVVGCLGGLG